MTFDTVLFTQEELNAFIYDESMLYNYSDRLADAIYEEEICKEELENLFHEEVMFTTEELMEAISKHVDAELNLRKAANDFKNAFSLLKK